MWPKINRETIRHTIPYERHWLVFAVKITYIYIYMRGVGLHRGISVDSNLLVRFCVTVWVAPSSCRWTTRRLKKEELWSFETSTAAAKASQAGRLESSASCGNALQLWGIWSLTHLSSLLVLRHEVLLLSLFRCYFKSLDVPTANVVKETDGNTQNKN